MRQQNLDAWTGEGYARAWGQLNHIFDMLNKENLFPAPPAKFLELGCGNAAMSSQLMAQKVMMFTASIYPQQQLHGLMSDLHH